MFGVGGEGREHMSVVFLLCIGIIAPVTDKKGYKFAILSEYLVPCLILRKLIVAICYPRSGILDWTFDIWHPRIDVRQPTSEIRNPTSNIWHPTSEIRNPKSEIRNRTSDMQHPRLDILFLSAFNTRCTRWWSIAPRTFGSLLTRPST